MYNTTTVLVLTLIMPFISQITQKSLIYSKGEEFATQKVSDLPKDIGLVSMGVRSLPPSACLRSWHYSDTHTASWRARVLSHTHSLSSSHMLCLLFRMSPAGGSKAARLLKPTLRLILISPLPNTSLFSPSKLSVFFSKASPFSSLGTYISKPN